MSPEDQIPLPSAPILTEAETSRQIQEAITAPLVRRIRQLEHELECWKSNARLWDKHRMAAEAKLRNLRASCLAIVKEIEKAT